MKQKTGEAPENLGEFLRPDGSKRPEVERGDVLPAEVLKLLNQLLETVHRAEGNDKHGSKIEFVYVASGGQHVETQINVGPHPGPPKGREKPLPSPLQKERESSLPEVLGTKEAMARWKKAQNAGWIDDNYQPLIPRTQAALLADAMAERLGIREKWKVFETLWNRKNIYRDFYEALNQKKSLEFQDELKMLLL